MSFYENLRDGPALNLLRQFGQSVTVRTKVTENYDTELGEVTQVESSEAGVGVLLPAGQPQAYVDENPARVIDTAVWILAASGLTAVPVPGTVIDDGGSSWAVIGTTPAAPGGVALVYRLLVKKMGVA